MTTKKTNREELRQAVEKILWREYNPGYSPNFEQVSEEIVAVFCHQKPESSREWEEGEREAMNIVYQLGDLLYETLPKDIAHKYFVKARQETNDMAIGFAQKIIRQTLLSERTALIEEIREMVAGMKLDVKRAIMESEVGSPEPLAVTAYNSALEDVLKKIE